MEIPKSETLSDYFDDYKIQYRRKMFISIQPDMDATLDEKNQPNIIGSAKRLLWRYLSKWVKANEVARMPKHFLLWRQTSEKESCMYSEKYHFRKEGLTQWEIVNCPWWIDFPDGSYPEDERQLYLRHSRGMLELGGSEMDIQPTDTSVGSKLESRLREKETLDQGKGEQKKHLRRGLKKNVVNTGVVDVQDLVPNIEAKRFCPSFSNLALPAIDFSNSKIFTCCGDLLQIAKGVLEKKLEPAMANIITNLKSMCKGGNKRKEKVVTYSADLVLLDFPGGFVPDGYHDTMQEWNVLEDGIFDAGLQFASSLVDDVGWVVCLVSSQCTMSFVRSMRRAGLEVFRQIVLLGTERFGVSLDGTQVYSILVYVLRREGCTPTTQLVTCNLVDSTQYDCKSDVWHHYWPAKDRLTDPQTGQQCRGGMEKNPALYILLLDLYCRVGGIVVDPMLGCGATLYACHAMGRHCIGMDRDNKVLEFAVQRHGKSEVLSKTMYMDVDDEEKQDWGLDDFDI